MSANEINNELRRILVLSEGIVNRTNYKFSF
jgi:hypothetical protein